MRILVTDRVCLDLFLCFQGIDSMTEVESGLEKGDVYMLNAMMKEDGNT
jgi:hypothetical protein